MSGMVDAAPVAFAPWLGVFETLCVINGVPVFVPEHLAEFRRAAEALGISADFDLEKRRLELPAKPGRWRWIATPAGCDFLFTEEKIAPADPVALSVSSVRVGSQNWDARFKTVSYLTHAQAVKVATTGEVILLNEHREVASAGRGNLFWRRGERLFTPSHETGCRRGVVRGFVMSQLEVEEGGFPLDDLLEADEIFLTNSMRGIVPVSTVEGRPVTSMAKAKSLRREYNAEVKRQLAAVPGSK
jgi:branched-chain amino acid aminotransferase/4-amino-4-deoxychorismate lyase